MSGQEKSTVADATPIDISEAAMEKAEPNIDLETTAQGTVDSTPTINKVIETGKVEAIGVEATGVKAEEVESAKVTSDEIKSVEVKPGEVKSEEVKSEDVKSADVKSDKVNTEKVSSDEIKLEQAKVDKNLKSEDEESTKDDRKRKRYDDEDKPRRTYQRQNFNDNIKSRYDLPESSDPAEIREQVEFYLSESNLLSDKYLFEQTGGAENIPIPIKTIHNFKRMRHFQPYSAVVEALKSSEVLEVVDGDSVKRKTPIKAEAGKSREETYKLYETEAMLRSAYVKGFGEETDTTQLDIEDFFKPFGPILSVRLRRIYPQKEFKGSAFIEFADAETLKAFLDLETKPKWQDNVELKIMSKSEYCAGKIDDINDGKVIPNSTLNGRGRGNGHRGGRGRGGGGRGGRSHDDRRGNRRDSRRDQSGDRNDNRNSKDWKERRSDFQKDGYKDRRSGRDGHGRDRRNKGEEKAPDVDENGIPIVHVSSGSPGPNRKADKKAAVKSEAQSTDSVEAPATNGASNDEKATAAVQDDASISKKRALDDSEGVGEQKEAKKVKNEEIPAAV